MASASCGPLPHSLYENWLRPPLEEGCCNIYYAYKGEEGPTSLSSLVKRVAHLVEGVLLMVPLVNMIALRVLQVLGWTVGQDFEKAVGRGDKERVKFYLDRGFDPNHVCVDGRPVLHHATDYGVIQLLLNRGADSQKTHKDGTLFLEHLAKTGRVGFAAQLVASGVDVTLCLTMEVFQRAKGNSECQAFLIHMGYDATFAERQEIETYAPKTDYLLETGMMQGDAEGIKILLTVCSFEEIEAQLTEILAYCPRLKTERIWTILLEGYLDGDAFDGEVVMKLLGKGAQIDPLKAKFGEWMLSGLIQRGGTEFARELVLKKVVLIAPYFGAEFLATRPSKKVVWFLIEMGYPQELRPGCGSDSFVGDGLEKIIFDSNEYQLKSYAREMSCAELLEGYEVLKKRYPRLNARWVWGAVANIYWTEGKYEDFLYLVNEGLHRPSDDFFMAQKNTDDNNRKRVLMQVGYRGVLLPVYGRSFETIMYSHDVHGIRAYIQRKGLQTFYNEFTALQSRYPRMYTGWVWDTLFTIPNTHYTQYARIQAEEELRDPPPIPVDYKRLTSLVDRVDFSGNQLGSKSTFIEAANKVVRGIKSGSCHIYAIPEEDRKILELHIQWIVYYLEKDLKPGEHLPGEKASALLDMLKECFNCHSRWHVSFEEAYRRLSGKEVKVSSFKEQLQKLLGDLRAHIIERLSDRDTHKHDNVVHYLRDIRAIPVKPVKVRDMYAHGFNSREAAAAAFDKLYTSGTMMEALFESAKGEFRGLIVDNLASSMAPRDAALRRSIRGRENKRVTYGELTGMGIARAKEKPTFEGVKVHLQALNWEGITFPIGRFNEAAIQAHHDVCVAELEDAYRGIDEAKRKERDQAWMEFQGAQNGTTRKEIYHFMEICSGGIQCGAQTLASFYAAHPEIPEELKKDALEGRRLDDLEVKKHLMSLALDMKYAFCPLTLQKCVEDAEQAIFREQVIVPMNEKGEPALRDQIHPLVLAKWLVDAKHLQPRDNFLNGFDDLVQELIALAF